MHRSRHIPILKLKIQEVNLKYFIEKNTRSLKVLHKYFIVCE